jgi:signal transduction histidine kinase
LEDRRLRPLIEDAMRRAEAELSGCRVHLDPTFDDASWVRCEPRLLGEALTSLIECAGKFSAPGEPVRVRCDRTDEEVRLVFQATGRGMPAALISRFFEIFALGAEPLTPGGDLGLGPPVAAQVLRLFGGSVAVEPAEDGVTFVVTLQPAPPAACVT